MRSIFCLSLLALFSSCATSAHVYSLFGHAIIDKSYDTQLKNEENEVITLDYNLLILKPQTPAERFPLILSFHGTGGGNGQYIETWERPAVKNRTMVLTPNRHKVFRSSEKNPEAILRLIEHIVASYPVDPRRIYLTGVSSGALIARKMLNQYPEKWRGVIFIAKPPYSLWPESAGIKKWPPIFYVSGALDSHYSIEKLKLEVAAVRKYSEQVSLLVDPAGGHEHREAWNELIFHWIKNPAVVQNFLLESETDVNAKQGRLAKTEQTSAAG